MNNPSHIGRRTFLKGAGVSAQVQEDDVIGGDIGLGPGRVDQGLGGPGGRGEQDRRSHCGK